MAILLTDFVDMCSSVASQIQQIIADSAKLQADNIQLGGDLTAANAQVAALNGQLSTVSQQVADLTGQVNGLNGQITTLTATNNQLSVQLATANTQVTALTAQLAIANQQIATLQAQLAAQSSKVSTPMALCLLTAHNCSNSPNYNKTTFPTLFTGTTHQNGGATVAVAIDSNLQDDSQNPAAIMNISKVSMHTLMPKAWTGKIINYLQAWWGFGNHPNIGFSNTNAADVARIMDDSASRGFDVVCPDWYGINFAGGNDLVVDLIAQNCARTKQTFCLMIDEQYLKSNGYVAATYQQGLVSAINHFAGKYFTHPQYEKVGTRPLLLLWGISALVGANIDWVVLKTQIQGNPLLIQYQAGGFNVPASDGALSWVDTNADTTIAPGGQSYLTNSMFPAFAAHQDKICISSVCAGFNGTLTKSASWSDGKFLDRRNGQTWLDWWKVNSDFVVSGKRLDYVAVVTWDDFQEGTTIQGGIRNDIAFTSVTIAANKLSWAVTGNENTVSYYNIYMSADSLYGTKIASVAPSAAKMVDLSLLNVPLGATVFVYALGQPCIQCHLSNGVVYNG